MVPRDWQRAIVISCSVILFPPSICLVTGLPATVVYIVILLYALVRVPNEDNDHDIKLA